MDFLTQVIKQSFENWVAQCGHPVFRFTIFVRPNFKYNAKNKYKCI